MANEELNTLLRQLRRIIDPAQGNTITDCQLLDRFVAHQDATAFEVLVWRHGPMVLGLCRRMLRHEQDAEDAFQAAFLALVRKAGSIGRRECVGSWLYRVAYRVALAARARRADRPLDEHLLVASAPMASEVMWRELRPILDEEVSRLPSRFRVPFVLCYLEGKTNEEAAQTLGCSRGTIGSRLSRARERLRIQLTRRGLTLTTAALTALLASSELSASMPGPLVSALVQAGVLTAAGQAVAGVVSTQVTVLTEGVLRAMFMNKLKWAAAALLMLSIAGLGTGLAFNGAFAVETKPAQTGGSTPSAPGDSTKPKPSAEPSSFVNDAKTDDPVEVAKRLAQTRLNLKTIGLAMHAYHDVTGNFPAPAIYKDGKPLLSWRVAILPWLDQQNLYRQFKLDEPWDSPHNKKLLAQMPKIYAPVASQAKEEHVTFYQVFVGNGAAFERQQPTRMVDILDGTSNTIMAVESATPVPWTKPIDLPYVEDQALPKLGGNFKNVFHALFMDGSVHTLSQKFDEATMRRAILRNDGEVFDLRKLEDPGAGEDSDLPGLPVAKVKQENERLKAAVKTAQDELQKLHDEMKLWQEISGRKPKPRLDAETLQLLQENAALEKKLRETTQLVEEMKKEMALLKLDAEKRLKEKPKP